MKKETIDISAKIGPMAAFSCADVEWPMYSYERPAYMLWNSIANGLKKRGWTMNQIQTLLQSKHTRWALDGELGDQLTDIGEKFAEHCTKVRSN